MSRTRPLVLLAVIAALFGVGYYARVQLGLEFSQESVASLIAGLGIWAWGIYLVIVVFRTFLLLPSAVVLSAGGIAFGASLGALLGGAGILISGVLWYISARGAGRPLIEQHMGSLQARALQARAEAAGPFLVGIVTAHPIGPLTPFHIGAGLAAIPSVPFLIAIGIGSPVRSSTLAFFGSSLLEFGTPRFFAATALVLVLGLLPLAHRVTRERFLSAFKPWDGGSI